MENYYLGAYWSNRPEGAGDCAKRALALMDGLSRCDEAFQRWFAKDKSRDEALRQRVEPNDVALKELFDRGRNRRDVGRDVIEDLGSRIGLWNGAPDGESIAMSLSCGGHASTAHTWIPNSCVINLPQEGASFERLVTVRSLLAVLEVVVGALDPDWAVVTSEALRGSVPKPEPGAPLVGWITYLSRAFGPLPDLRENGRVLRLGAGSAIVIGADLFTAKNAQHLGLASEVRGALEQAGLLRRIA